MKSHTSRQKIGLVLGPVLFILFAFFIDLDPGRATVSRTAGIALWIAVWWVTEAMPNPATSLLPLVLFPLSSVAPGDTVAREYMNSSIFLFMGGFLIALAMEKCRLHRRIALNILNLIGDRPRRLILEFMLTTAFLSMWISNTATTMMMLPIAIAVIAKSEERSDSATTSVNFPQALMLGSAYSASIGGIGTLIGTPPNIAFSRIYTIAFPER